MTVTRNSCVLPRLAAAAMLTLSACASSDSGTYSSRDVGQVIETSRGRVVSSRPVDISSSEQSGLGAATGGVVGGIAGSTIGKGKGQSLATAAGILIGVLVGSMVEHEMRSGQGTEYTVEMDDGRVVTIVQNQKSGEAPIPDGQDVAVQYGADYTRLTPIGPGSPTQQTASNPGGASGYPSSYPPSRSPASAPAASGSGSYPYPADPAGGGATVASAGASGAPVRPGDSEWRNPDLEPGGAPTAGRSSSTDSDPGGAPIFVPGPSNAN